MLGIAPDMEDTMVNESNCSWTHGTFNLSEKRAKEQVATSVLSVEENPEPSERLLHGKVLSGVDVVP